MAQQLMQLAKNITHPGDVLKAFPEMGLDSRGILGLGEDLKQLIIGQEVEPGEGGPLGLQVLTKTLLDLVQELVALLQVVQEPGIRTQGDDLVGSKKYICNNAKLLLKPVCTSFLWGNK